MLEYFAVALNVVARGSPQLTVWAPLAARPHMALAGRLLVVKPMTTPIPVAPHTLVPAKLRTAGHLVLASLEFGFVICVARLVLPWLRWHNPVSMQHAMPKASTQLPSKVLGGRDSMPLGRALPTHTCSLWSVWFPCNWNAMENQHIGTSGLRLSLAISFARS